MTSLKQRIIQVQQHHKPLLAGIARGVEKESLRVTPDGLLAQTPHPEVLGATLTHPSITTDYSEALLEFITPPSTSVAQVLETLEDIHSFVYQNIGDELLWVNSMPCMLGQEKDIPVAQYGSSNIAKMKSIYRIGLGHRYGKFMQTIAGIHYNFSLPEEFWIAFKVQERSSLSLQDFKTDRYLALIRNFRRHLWLLLYLFGSAPAVCRSFVKNRDHNLVPIGEDDHSLYAPYATSLRMGDLGYQSTAQQDLMVCYNSLPTYIATLHEALTTPYPAYNKIDALGPYQQLNANLLEIENEFYSTIRPKRTAKSGEAPLLALKNNGIEYIEVRCLDLDPFAPVGITAEQMHFLDCFLVYCLLSESPLSDENEYRDIQRNQQRAVYQGRDPALTLYCKGEKRAFQGWATEIFEQLAEVATLLDTQQNTHCHAKAVKAFGERIVNPDKTPSKRLLDSMRSTGKTYYQQSMDQAVAHREHFKNRPLSAEKIQQFNTLAKQSIADQKQIEVSDSETFDAFLEHYFQQYQLLT